MRIYEPNQIAFAIGEQLMAGAMTYVYLLDRKAIETRDPEGLNPIDATRILHLPDLVVPTYTGVCAYMGPAEAARNTLRAKGFFEAPVGLFDHANDTLRYVSRNETDDGVVPVARVLHSLKGDTYHFLSRFPGEPDVLLGWDDLPEAARKYLPRFSAIDGFTPALEAAHLQEWFTKKLEIAAENA